MLTWSLALFSVFCLYCLLRLRRVYGSDLRRINLALESLEHIITDCGVAPEIAAGGFSRRGRDALQRLQGLSALLRLKEIRQQEGMSHPCNVAQRPSAELPALDEPHAFEGFNVEAELLPKLCKRLACDCCALISAGTVAEHFEVLAAFGADKERLRQALWYNGHIAGILHDRHRTPGAFSPAAELSGIGLGVSLMQPLHRSSAAGDVKYIFLLAYRSGVTPSVYDLRQVQAILTEVDVALCGHLQSSALREKVLNAEHSDREKSKFLAQISHDIRSPLNNIKSILTLVQLEGLQNKKDEHGLIEIALSNCDALAELVEDVLEFTRFQAGRLSTKAERVRLSACLEEVAGMFSVSAKMKGINLSLEIEDGSREIFALVDRRHIKRILVNIVSNAVKYTRHGRVIISLNAPGCSPQIVVRDTGIGLSSEQLDSLFTPFTCFASSEPDGIGLGLALSKILAERNGCTISVDSKLGEGSRFVISLPLAAHNDSAVDLHPAKVNAPQAVSMHRASQCVLVVDDDADCVATLCKNLEAAGFGTQKAYTIFEAINFLSSANPPSAVITDCAMPHGGGKRLLKYIKSQALAAPVFVLSGDDPQLIEDAYRFLGAAKILTKPVDINLLIEALDEVCLDQKIAVHAGAE